MNYAAYYPPSPKIDRSQFTKINSAYRTNVVIVLFSIILFFLLYLAAVAGSCYLVYLAFTYDMENVNKFTIFLKIGSIGMSTMFALFMIKFLFNTISTSNLLNKNAPFCPVLQNKNNP